MPEIEVTADQHDRLRDLQRRLEAEMASPYATVRPDDAVAYLLDRYAADGEVVLDGVADASADAGDERGDDAPADPGASEAPNGGPTADGDETGDGSDATRTSASGSDLPSGPMSLLADHEDVWSEGSGEARYEVELPDGSVEEARTRGDVRALLFEHYRGAGTTGRTTPVSSPGCARGSGRPSAAEPRRSVRRRSRATRRRPTRRSRLHPRPSRHPRRTSVPSVAPT